MTESSKHLPYFAPLLPWQCGAWEQVTTQFHEDKLPHGLLASGMAGIGKREFVWRFVAWLLCQQKTAEGACGSCQSCHWLMAGTHPDLKVLPLEVMPRLSDGHDNEPSTAVHEGKKLSIKIDEVRELQEYSHMKGQGLRLVVLDHADNLTIGAGNALLKTLEEPRAGVHLVLISDNPAKLMPTIKSRVQVLPLSHVAHEVALAYVSEHLQDIELAKLALNLSDGAVLKAIHLPQSAWFDKRTLWLKTWLTLRHGERAVVSASDYWQGVMSFDDFAVLTRLMLMEVMRVGLLLDGIHTDIDMAKMMEQTQALSLEGVEDFLASLDDMAVAVGQNVQDKMAYDELFYQLASL